LLGILFIYLLQRLQFFLPLNPQAMAAVAPDLAFNNAASFTTNTNWQAYAGESTMSYLTQSLGFTVQNFLSAASGMAVVVALIRGLVRHETNVLGNFWVDLTRGVLYILLPLAMVLALLLSAQGVIQNFKPYEVATLTQPLTVDNKIISQQIIPMGPVASQEAIKQLGTNGGGFFNVNSAHPFENPDPKTNFLEMLAILLIPAALCYSFGLMVGDVRQGWALLIAMFLIFTPLVCLTLDVEQAGNPQLTQIGINQMALEDLSPGGNMEGKESRFGIVNSAIWTVATTASGNGSVNSMLDSYIPLGGLMPLWLIQLAEVVFGGVGSGLAGMLIFVVLTVFVAGLMVGRTPEYLGKKIEPYEMKMASFTVLLMPVIVLLSTAISVVTKAGTAAIANPGPHGLTEILYAFTSLTNNNGSAFAGINANTLFYNVVGGIVMLLGRYWIAIPTLAIAGSLARKKTIPVSPGTLPTNTLLFIILLISVVLVFGALTFFPVLALGPIVEQLIMGIQHVR
jgi:K+-transporting ATPase ATPase A chain